MRNLLNAVWSFPLTRIFAFLVILFLVIILGEPIIIALIVKAGKSVPLVVFLWTEVWHLLISFGLLALFVKKVERAKLSDFGMSMKTQYQSFCWGLLLGHCLSQALSPLCFAWCLSTDLA